MSHEKHITVEFLEPTSVGPRNWGEELLLGVVPGAYSFKLLKMKKGHKGGLQRHHKKNEMQYLISGSLEIEFDSGDGSLQKKIMQSGDAWHIPPGAVHREHAVTECVILEASTPHFNDRVRMEEQYGEQIPEGGLPSTTIDQVEER